MTTTDTNGKVHKFLDPNRDTSIVRTRQEIADAWQQAWDRRHDVDDQYYDAFGWGYLAGIQKALGWVLGKERNE
jgi:hypothetical protein